MSDLVLARVMRLRLRALAVGAVSPYVLGTVFAGALAAGCGAACDPGHVCAVVGDPGSLEVCDGQGFHKCDDDNRGAIVACVRSPKRAVCSPGGWTFEDAPVEMASP
jgi:hypothetical protein